MDPQQKKVALRAITYGLCVLTSRHDGEYGAASINWLTQASFEPPLIVVGCKADSETNRIIKSSGVFALGVLGEAQLDIGKAFFRPTKVEEGTMNGYRFEPGPATGCPILADLPYWVEARVTDTVDRGDHTIFVAEVVEAGVRDATVQPLVLRTTGLNYGG